MPGQTNKQKEIIEVSIKLIADHGIANLSIRKIAKEIGRRESSIYNHFKSKEEILQTILSNFMTDVIELQQEVKSLKTTYLKKIEYFYKKMCKEINDYPAHNKVLSTADIFAGYPLLQDDYHAIIKKYRELVVGMLLSAQKAKEIRNDVSIDYLVPIILGTFDAIIRRRHLIPNHNFKVDSDQFWETIKKLLT